jgi:hypothetical protein
VRASPPALREDTALGALLLAVGAVALVLARS